MKTNDTPETDAQYKEYARRDNDVQCVDIEFARKLERERDEARRKLETYRELCDRYEKERDQLRAVCDALAKQLTDWSFGHADLSAYEQLPHVKGRKGE